MPYDIRLWCRVSRYCALSQIVQKVRRIQIVGRSTIHYTSSSSLFSFLPLTKHSLERKKDNLNITLSLLCSLYCLLYSLYCLLRLGTRSLPALVIITSRFLIPQILTIKTHIKIKCVSELRKQYM